MDLFLREAPCQHSTRLRGLFGVLALLLPLLITSCSPKTTTPQSRLWQGFITRYNTLYHAHEAYAEGYEGLLSSIQDDYTRPLPLDPLVDDLAEGQERATFVRTLAKTRKAIAEHSMTRKPAKKSGWRHDPKAVALQAKTEYNPALSDAWLLTARALFYSGKLEEARLTAEGILLRYATELEVREEARLWAVRSLIHLGRLGEAEELLRLFPQGGATDRLRRSYLYSATTAELQLAEGRWEDALPALRDAAVRAREKKQRARLHFLLGQIYLRLGRSSEAEGAFLRSSQLADEPALELAGRLRALQLRGDSRSAQSVLRRLGQMRRYRGQQDQIFLALGQSFLGSRQTALAETSLQRAIDSARQHTTAWAEAQLTLGELALATDRYPEAYQRMMQAGSVLHPLHPQRPRLDSLLPGLALLEAPAREVRRGDSLLWLVRLPEAERLRYIDSLIHQTRRRHRSLGLTLPPTNSLSPEQQAPLATAGFYFDRPDLVAEGRKRFIQRWGDRPLTDDWNRSRRSLLANSGAPSPQVPSTVSPTSEPVGVRSTDSLSRAFYLQSLPLGSEAQRDLSEKIGRALLQQANLLSEKLELPDHAERSYARLLRDFPAFSQREEALQQALFLALRRGLRAEADSLRELYLVAYPQSSLSLLLRQTDYPQALRQQAQEPERLYGLAWEAYQQGELAVSRRQLDSRDPLPLLPADLRPKVRLLKLLTLPSTEARSTLIEGLRQLQQEAPESEVAPYVGSLLAGLEQGRPLRSLPLQRSSRELPVELGESHAVDSLNFLPFVEGQTPELLLLYPKGQGVRHEVYFTLMTFVFSHFTQWSLETSPLDGFTSWEGFRMKGFLSVSALKDFLAQAQQAEELSEALPQGALWLPVAPANLPLLSDETLPAYRRYLDTLSPRP